MKSSDGKNLEKVRQQLKKKYPNQHQIIDDAVLSTILHGGVDHEWRERYFVEKLIRRIFNFKSIAFALGFVASIITICMFFQGKSSLTCSWIQGVCSWIQGAWM